MDFKRGFLNTIRGQACLSKDRSRSADQTKKGPEIVAETTRNPTTATNLEASADHGGHTDEPDDVCKCLEGIDQRKGTVLDLHVAPASHQEPGKTRAVFRVWPRAPDGQVIGDTYPERGKMTPNGCQIWGHTLWDFFTTMRSPDLTMLRTTTSGSLMRAHMLRMGELETCSEELEWAEMEPEPKQVLPFSLGTLLRDQRDQLCPFLELDDDAPILQDIIPFHLLPEKLIVHDPWNTLSARDADADHDTNERWVVKEDITHTYTLSLSPEGEKKREEHRLAAVKEDDVRAKKDEWHIMDFTSKEEGSQSPGISIHAKIPPRCARPKSIPEAHLYIHRPDRAGKGNHSVVYNVELELPRWVVTDDILCDKCWVPELEKEVKERVASGTLLSHEETGKQPIITRTSKIMDERGSVVMFEAVSHSKECLERTACLPERKYVGTVLDASVEIRKTRKTEDVFSGPTAYFDMKAEWQRPGEDELCEHIRLSPTVRVQVCAKMSVQHDEHLAREAKNYQSFPAWFWEHWTGYNVVYPLHEPTPCGAIVPQFYGYYVPEIKPVEQGQNVGDKEQGRKSEQEDDGAQEDKSLPQYLSPLLLLENCGQQVQVQDLNTDERNTCAALYFHLFDGGWTQGSIAPRNVLWQWGPITEYSLAAAASDRRQRIFRLIDFGRALEIGERPRHQSYSPDREEVCQLFEVVYHHRVFEHHT